MEGKTLLEACQRHGQREAVFAADMEELEQVLIGLVRPGDLVLTLGAGNIVQAGEALLQQMEK